MQDLLCVCVCVLLCAATLREFSRELFHSLRRGTHTIQTQCNSMLGHNVLPLPAFVRSSKRVALGIRWVQITEERKLTV